MLEDLLHPPAEQLRAEATAHSTDNFMHRPAAQAAEEARRPDRIQQLPTTTTLTTPQASSPGTMTQRAPSPTVPTATRPGGPSQPRTRRGQDAAPHRSLPTAPPTPRSPCSPTSNSSASTCCAPTT